MRHWILQLWLEIVVCYVRTQYIHNLLVQTRSLKMFEEQVKHSGLLGRVLSWKALNVFYSVKNFKGPMFPGQAIVLRGVGPVHYLVEEACQTLWSYSDGFLLKWAHLTSITTQAALWRCKWATKHKCDSVSCQRLTGSQNIHTHHFTLCKMYYFALVVPAQCLRFINESGKERGHQYYVSQIFFIRRF